MQLLICSGRPPQPGAHAGSHSVRPHALGELFGTLSKSPLVPLFEA